MKKHLERVTDFMIRADQYKKPITEQVRILRAKLTFEEAIREKIHLGLGVNIYGEDDHSILEGPLAFIPETPINMEQLADGIADTNVVNNGDAIAFGIPIEAVQQEVDYANLRKFGSGGYRRNDGKWMKPPDWKAPNVAGILEGTHHIRVESEIDDFIKLLKTSNRQFWSIDDLVQIAEGMHE